MTLLEAIILGIVQGAGEFLPISSSGHLIAVPWLLGYREHSLAFDVALHLGTLVAVAGALIGYGLGHFINGRHSAGPKDWQIRPAAMDRGMGAGLTIGKQF